MLWSHAIFNSLPNYSYYTGNDGEKHYFYGENYPLDLVDGDWSYWNTNRRVTDGVPRALQAGITGMQILQIAWEDDQTGTRSTGIDFLEEWWKSADPLWPNNHFMIAPCIEIDTIKDASPPDVNSRRVYFAVTHIIEYLASAKNHPSSAKVHGKYVIYIYAIGAYDSYRGKNMMTPADWLNVRAQVDAAGYAGEYFLIAQLESAASQFGWTFGNKVNLAPYITPTPCFDAWYTFEERLELIWDEVVEFINRYKLVYAGGIMPGYNRENYGTTGGFTDAEGTRRFRHNFAITDGAGLSWNNTITWSDFVEHSEVMATSDWNRTRADITAFYSARLRDVAYPRPRPELYITTPKAIFVGDSFGAEGMVLNAGSSPVTIYVQLFDSAMRPVGTTIQETIPGYSAGDATVSLSATQDQANTWYRAQATMFDAAGVLLQQVISAPICVYPAGATPTNVLRRLYYSIPAYAALPAYPTLSIPANPVSSVTAATITAPDGVAVRYGEVLQNTRQVSNGYSSNPYSISIPMITRSYTSYTYTSTANGFYVARVIDEQERVGYSDPLFFS